MGSNCHAAAGRRPRGLAGPTGVAVPGGLGTARSGLVAGLIPLGVAGGAATSAVLVHRLLTFRLHVPLGTLALRAVQRKGYA